MKTYQLPRLLTLAAETHFNANGCYMSVKDVAQWTYLATAQDTMLVHLDRWPALSSEYMSMVNRLNAQFSRGILTASEYIEKHVETAMDMVHLIENMEDGDSDPRPLGATLFDEHHIYVWLNTGIMLEQDWSSHMPWSPQSGIAMERFNMFLDREEVMGVAKQWSAGEWTSMHHLGETGEIIDFYSLCKELDECLIEAGDVDLHAMRLYNLYATIALLVQPATLDNEDY